MTQTNSNPIVSELNIYPVKSLSGITLQWIPIEKRGFLFDRLWMVVETDGEFLTQREIPKMALIKTDVDNEHLTLSAPQIESISVPIDFDGENMKVQVWRDSDLLAIDQGYRIAEWLSDFLGVTCRLVKMAEDTVRQVDQEFALQPSDQVGFADAYPFLLISQASLDDLNTRLEEPLPMNRFRPNIVVQNAMPYAEDTWKTIQIGEVIFDIVKSCVRCAITTTDQETAARGKEPLKTLSTYRNSQLGVIFGQNMTHRMHGNIELGQEVQVLEYQ